jgi:myo-inositol-1(or 4)-monophosphatase
MWSISIGLIDDGDPVVGVIALPWAGELFWAARDGGAWLGDKRISATDATIFHEHDNVSISTNAIRVIDPRSIPGRIRDLGSACCELSFVSCGRLRASIFLGEQAHDLAAGVVIATEAGCRFRALGGSDLSAAQFVAGTPVCTPTLIGPPGRLEQLAKQLRLLPPLV